MTNYRLRDVLPFGRVILAVILLLALVSMLVLFGMPFVAWQHAPRASSLAIVGLWGALVALMLWQGLGVIHALFSGGFWAFRTFMRVVTMAVVGYFVMTLSAETFLQMEEFWAIAKDEDRHGDYVLTVSDDGRELTLNGGFGFGLTQDVERLLDANPDMWLMRLNSDGGRVFEGRLLAALIERRGLSTFAGSKGCHSACVIPFVAGAQRLISRRGQIGFHQYAFPGIAQAEFASQYEVDIAFMRRRGVAEWFIAVMYQAPAEEIWTPSHCELLRAGYVTKLPTWYGLRDRGC